MVEQDDLRLLHIDIETMFVISAEGRIVRQNDPDASPGPRVVLVGCSQGNIVRVRYDLSDEMARNVLAITAEEPPWRDPHVLPRCLGQLIDLLSYAQQTVVVRPALIYRLPNHVEYEPRAAIVRSDSEEGEKLVARFNTDGMPQPMIDAGYTNVGHLWEPWCLALEGDEVAAIAIAARLGDRAAEVGVYTFAKFRGRGLAAAVTANWSAMRALESRALFYSTWRANRSSQRVTARLGLGLIGASVSLE